MEFDGFPILPPELQLLAFSHLSTTELNSLRLSCKQIQNLVDGNAKKLYRRMVDVKLDMSNDLCLGVFIHFFKFEFFFAFDGTLTLKDVVRTAPDRGQIDDEEIDTRAEILRQTSINSTLEEFFERITERCGGVKLKLSGVLSPDRLEMLLPLLHLTRKIQLECTIDRIPKEVIYSQLIAPKRRLYLDIHFYESMPGIVDDAFCRDAGTGSIKLDGGYISRFLLTDDQLLSLVRRRDLEEIFIHEAIGPSLEAIRAAAQELLHTQASCDLMFKTANETEDEVMNTLSSQHEDEIVDKSLEPCLEFVYTLIVNGRSVKISYTSWPDFGLSTCRVRTSNYKYY